MKTTGRLRIRRERIAQLPMRVNPVSERDGITRAAFDFLERENLNNF